MTLIPLDLPPGVRRGGTDFESVGRWRDASLVRWHEGIMQPVGGWRDRGITAITDPARGAISWADNAGDRWLSAGTYDTLYAVTASGALHDITPVGLTTGLQDAGYKTGYGGGFYGTGFYGVERPDAGTYSEATTWSMDTWGEYLVACTADDGVLYEWQLNTGTPAAAIANAPTGCLGLVVTEERFLFALGAGGDPRNIAWCDREDNTTWTPLATNEVGSQILETSSQIMAGVQGRGETLIITETDAHTATYRGPPHVYGFQRVGKACGLSARRAFAAVRGGVIWMGVKGFYIYRGGAVEPLPCEVQDYVFSNINTSQATKVFAVANSVYDEVWWFYPSEESIECDSYVSFNHRDNIWMTGKIDRVCGVDRGVFRRPIWLDTAGNFYDHETGLNWDTSEVYAESGPVSIGTGESTFMATSLYPDEGTQGDVNVTFKTRFYPNDTEREYGPYSMSAPTDVRFSGRQARMRVTPNGLKDFRWGIPRLDVKQMGIR